MVGKILAVSSGGGHWEQLQIVSASFEGHAVFYANTIAGLAEKSGIYSARSRVSRFPVKTESES